LTTLAAASSMTTPVETTPQLTALRKLMQQRNLDAYLVPGEDAHQSEYVAECDKRRQFISGFSGSSGFAVVTLTEALLFTDGRYWLQASRTRASVSCSLFSSLNVP